MASNSSVNRNEISGTSSRKSTVRAIARAKERAAAQEIISSDPKFKKYSQQVEKCLTTFENVHEWPDFIAFLKQLLKTFQSYMQFKDIPRKVIVAKRLSQCLNPALPSGVHQRALDVYSHILVVLGPEGLKRDLQLWSSGLFPFFEYASTTVKPTLLNIFDTHYLPLDGSLRPLMKSFILALLPGLEEETGEFFEKVMNLLDRLSGTVSPAFFLQNIWLIMLTTQVSRTYALNFLARRLPRLDANDDVTSIVGRDIGLMIRAFSAALEDDNLFVQRGALDLLEQSLRIDSTAVRQASVIDRAILVRAASSVVLRRDVSLNRRLFKWLLGAVENSEKQMSYFRAHALELLRSTLRNEMFNPSAEYAESRPFKIFISLLDQWEIGSLLTDSLIYDSFIAIKKSIDTKSDNGEDMLITANTLYESVEPRVLWKRLFEAVRQELTTVGTHQEAIGMLLFIVKKFRLHEEEVQKIHLPMTFSAVVEILTNIVRNDPSKATTHTTRAAMYLLEEMLRHMPNSALTDALEITDIPKARGFDEMACMFYGLDMAEHYQCIHPSNNPFLTTFENLLNFTSICVKSLSAAQPETDVQGHNGTWLALAQGLLLLVNLLMPLSHVPPLDLIISWDPQRWLEDILGCLSFRGCSFLVVDRLVTVAGSLSRTKAFKPTLSIDDRLTLSIMMKALLKYLQPNCSPYHIRAVNLIWTLEGATGHRHVESIIARSLTSTEAWNIPKAYESFGVLWRLTDDVLLPGFRFKVPMLIVLDSLKSDNPSLRRTGETWMRCNLKAYTRVLDPILFELTDPVIRRTGTVTNLKGQEIHSFLYEQPFDQRRIQHLLDTLLHVVRFGGQGINKVASSTAIHRSLSQELVERLSISSTIRTETSYMDILVELLLRFLQSEPKQSLFRTMHHLNVSIHSTVIDILQAIVSRSETGLPMVANIEAAVISKLFQSIHMSRLDVQNKLLHLLHSNISVSAASLDRERISKTNPGLPLFNGSQEDQLLVQTHSESFAIPTVDPLLIQTLVDGITMLTNRPLLQHWLDFVMMTVSQFPQLMSSVISPLTDCVCRQLSSAMNEVHTVFSKNRSIIGDIASSVDDAEIIMLLNALERLVLFNLPDVTDTSFTDEGGGLTEKGGPDSSGLLTYVSNVFISENQGGSSESQLSARSPGYRSLHEGIEVLYSVWVIVSQDPGKASPTCDTLSYLFNRTRLRCRKAFERLFRAKSFEVIESIVDCWHKCSQDNLHSQDDAFEIVDFLTASSQNVVHVICESIFTRITTADRSRKQVVNPNLTDAILFAFLEGYLEKLEGPLAAQVWNRYLTLAKEVASNGREFKLQVFPVLKCMTVLASKITQTTAIEDRRMRKDIQETFGKLLDACILIAGRSFDQGNWIRRGNKDSLNVNSRDSPIPRVTSETKLDENLIAASPFTADVSKLPSGVDLIDQINLFLADKALPNLRRFIVDNDKVSGACNNIVYYIVNPALRKSSQPLDVDEVVLKIIEEMAKIPAAIKSWRSPISEVFNDSRFFNVSPDIGQRWRPIIKALIDTDKTAFGELLGKIAITPSANIFTNRKYEMLLRSINLRRLSYVLYTAEKNHFLTQLPAIQEKLVDILRNSNGGVMESEVYLCIRVLLCRLSPHNLSSFWPVLLTELFRIFEQLVVEPPSDGSDELQVVLAACKLLDLLLVLQTEEFQIHQWIFITDTVDAVYRPDDLFPEAFMDQLAEIVGDLPVAEKNGSNAESERSKNLPDVSSIDTSSANRSLRRPLLKSVKQIDSIRDLASLFSHISMMSYESVYASRGIIDWEAVEQGLVEDMFEGH